VDDKEQCAAFRFAYHCVAGFVFYARVERKQERVEEDFAGARSKRTPCLVAFDAAFLASQMKSMPLWR